MKILYYFIPLGLLLLLLKKRFVYLKTYNPVKNNFICLLTSKDSIGDSNIGIGKTPKQAVINAITGVEDDCILMPKGNRRKSRRFNHPNRGRKGGGSMKERDVTKKGMEDCDEKEKS